MGVLEIFLMRIYMINIVHKRVHNIVYTYN